MVLLPAPFAPEQSMDLSRFHGEVRRPQSHHGTVPLGKIADSEEAHARTVPHRPETVMVRGRYRPRTITLSNYPLQAKSCCLV